MKSFKWLVVLMLAGFFSYSCLDDEPTVNVKYLFAPIDSVQIGEIKPARQVTEIRTFYTRNNECETFFDYDYTITGNERTVTMLISSLQANDCLEITEADFHTLQFRPEQSGLYTFRFWNGNDQDGQPIFIIRKIEIP